MAKNKPRLVVILGPTASGKSAFAVKLARKLARTKWGGFNGAEIISADSRQVYKGLNIGTGKITKREMRSVHHHLLDVANPKERFTVVEFQKLAREKIAEIFSRGRLPILVGGTGFYIEAVINNVVLPDVSPNPKLRARLRGQTAETLLNMLMKLDPSRARSVDQKNPRRIIRAIEIARSLGSVPPIEKSAPPYNILQIGLTLPPEELKKKIAGRLDSRLKIGMIAEAKHLHAKGLSWKRMEELGLGYRCLALFLQSKLSKPEMIAKLQTEIWHYAKRQMTWFRRDKKIKWQNPAEQNKIEKEVRGFLRK